MLFFVAFYKTIFADTVQFNMDILVDAHQIQFSVFLCDMYLAGKISARVFCEVLRRRLQLFRPAEELCLTVVQDCRDAGSKAVLV